MPVCCPCVTQHCQNLLHATRRWGHTHACTMAPCLLASQHPSPTCIHAYHQSGHRQYCLSQSCSINHCDSYTPPALTSNTDSSTLAAAALKVLGPSTRPPVAPSLSFGVLGPSSPRATRASSEHSGQWYGRCLEISWISPATVIIHERP